MKALDVVKLSEEREEERLNQNFKAIEDELYEIRSSLLDILNKLNEQN